MKLQFADRPVDPANCSSASPTAGNVVAGGAAQNAGNAVLGGAAPDAAQDTAMSGGADGCRTIPRETEDDEERAKRQRTEKKTELEMEVSNVAKISDRRKMLDQRRDGWELENNNRRDAAMFCTCKLRPRVILTRCTKRSQMESTWDLCRAQGTQRPGYVCELVENVADDPRMKNIHKSTECSDTIIRDSLSRPSISVISSVDDISRRLQRSMKETGLLNSEDIDKVVEDRLDEEGEEMVANDVKKGSCPIRLVNQAEPEEQTYIEKVNSRWSIERRPEEAKWSGPDGSSLIRERQRNQIFGLNGLRRSSNGWMPRQ